MTDKREQIEAVATRAIKKDGLRSVSFRDLASEVGVKSASVHYHFPAKSDLALAVVSGYTDRFAEQLASIDRKQKRLKGKLNGFIKIFDDVVAQKDLCLCGMMASEINALDEQTQIALRRFFDLSEAWLENVFSDHQAELVSDLSPKQLAKILMSGLEGATLLDRVDGRTDRIKAFRALASTLTE